VQSCYMCDQPGTSREHVPPKCFFPEKKDLPPDVDFRVNLITVASRDEHNLRMSGDDQYVLLVIVGNWQNNPEA
jgi:hypothetical protein